jgi:1-acyl-sn-glycerol-3-phosphate acyltransferase
MRGLIATTRLLRVLVHLLSGMALMALRFRRLDESGRQRLIQWWSTALLRHIGLQIRVNGQVQAGAGLLVANHVSWLDIAAIHSACPQARFVSKADVLKWPLVGFLVRGAGTLFIERERKRDAMRVVHEMAAAMQRGDLVAVFPEGTTGEGARALPFVVEALVQPVVLRFTAPDEAFATATQFVGETTLVQSIWRIACARGLGVDVSFLPAQASAHLDRRALAETLRSQVQAMLDACQPGRPD